MNPKTQKGRKKRSKKTFESIFDNVKGMGPKRVKKIWEVYNSAEEFKKDSLNSIHKKTNIPLSVIENLMDVL